MTILLPLGAITYGLLFYPASSVADSYVFYCYVFLFSVFVSMTNQVLSGEATGKIWILQKQFLFYCISDP